MNRVIPGFILLILFPSLMVYSQISGVVNDYSEVLSIDYNIHSVEVADPSMFALNDRVLLIQMKGATIDETNTASFGNPALNNSGKFEMATVCNVFGSEILFQYQLENDYDTSAIADSRIQLVKVPQYTDITVNGTLTAQDWNGTTGGVLAIEASGTLTLNADIDVSGQGFRGGVHHIANTCGCILNAPDWYYPNLGTGANIADGGQKGEGIAEYIANKEYGKGAQGTGGGGGNNHNNGGAGGGNYGTGGTGGFRNGVCCANFQQAVGGKPLSSLGYANSTEPQIFMGGGGGVGHDNNGDGVSGADGGGIIIIMANVIEGNGNAIRANGDSPAAVFGDGGSGGGAGGAILFEVGSFGSTGLTVEANGGDGGNTGQGSNCPGPGGGGSGGVVWVSGPLLPSMPSVNGGAAGTATACSSNNGAAAGGTGGYLSGFSVVENITTLSACVLSSDVSLVGFWGENGSVDLNWTMEGIPENTEIEIERNISGSTDFVSQHDFVVNQSNFISRWTDYFPEGKTIRYRLKLTGPQGAVWYSNQVELTLSGSETFIRRVFPNPLTRSNTLNIQAQFADQQKVIIEVFDQTGKSVATFKRQANQGQNLLEIPVSELAEGVYLLKITHKNGQDVQSFLMVSN